MTTIEQTTTQEHDDFGAEGLTVPQASRLSGKHPSYFYDGINNGKVKGGKFGGMYLVHCSEVIRLVEERAIQEYDARRAEAISEDVDSTDPKLWTESDKQWAFIKDPDRGDKWRTNYNNHNVTLFQSNWGTGWTFTVDGKRPTYPNSTSRIYWSTRQEARQRGIEMAARMPNVVITSDEIVMRDMRGE